MTTIQLSNVSKRFGDRWLFKNIDATIKHGAKVSVSGLNGSGKSTFLQIIAGAIRPTNGSVKYFFNDAEIEADERYKQFSFAAPYMDLPEELTTQEFISFYIAHQPLIDGISPELLIDLSFLSDSKNKIIRSFSSGMKQRLKLSCAILAQTNIILLDEPLSNLDHSGISFYKKLIADYAAQKTVVVCSNDQKEEISFCTQNINIADFS